MFFLFIFYLFFPQMFDDPKLCGEAAETAEARSSISTGWPRARGQKMYHALFNHITLFHTIPNQKFVNLHPTIYSPRKLTGCP